jgi:hypothetical protein
MFPFGRFAVVGVLCLGAVACSGTASTELQQPNRTENVAERTADWAARPAAASAESPKDRARVDSTLSDNRLGGGLLGGGSTADAKGSDDAASERDGVDDVGDAAERIEGSAEPTGDGPAAGDAPPRVDPQLRWSWAWAGVGTIAFLGVPGRYFLNTPAVNANYVLVEAPQYCAPRVTGAEVRFANGAGGLPLWFEGQRYWGGNIQAVYRVGAGIPVWIGQVAFYMLPTWGRCPVNVYVVNGVP